MAANTDNRVKIKELVMIVAACLISLILYHVAGQVIEGQEKALAWGCLYWEDSIC